MTKEELIAKMAASAGITKIAAGTARSIHPGGDFLVEKGQRVSSSISAPLRFPSEKPEWEEIRGQVNHSESQRQRSPSSQPGKSFVLL